MKETGLKTNKFAKVMMALSIGMVALGAIVGIADPFSVLNVASMFSLVGLGVIGFASSGIANLFKPKGKKSVQKVQMPAKQMIDDLTKTKDSQQKVVSNKPMRVSEKPEQSSGDIEFGL